MDSDSPAHSPKLHRKLGSSVPLPIRATVISSEVQVSRPQLVSSQRSSRDRSGSMNGENNHAKHVIKGEGTPPKRFQRVNSRSDFLQQVAEKLADRSTTSTVSGSESASPPDTPMLPTLSPTSSVATFVFVSTSDSSALSSDDDDEGHRRRRRSSSRGRGSSGTPKGRRDRASSLGSGMITLSHPDRHSRPQRPCSFWSAPRIATSGQVQQRKSAIHGLPVTLRMLRVKSDKSDWFSSQSIVFTNPFKTGMSLDLARGRDSWC